MMDHEFLRSNLVKVCYLHVSPLTIAGYNTHMAFLSEMNVELLVITVTDQTAVRHEQNPQKQQLINGFKYTFSTHESLYSTM